MDLDVSPHGNQSGDRLRLLVRGAVQGVGFRPFVYRLATELGLTGWANNSARGVAIEVEGSREGLICFQERLQREKPPRSQIQSLEASWLEPLGYQRFEIRASEKGDRATSAIVLPDIATCPDCLREIFDATNRRYRYPFTNCTNCGPRYSIIEALPYDRDNTTMRGFAMCPQCQAEYENPGDRRFHAQPNACPQCGPRLAFWDGAGKVLATGDRALELAAEGVRSGQIIAIKGLGGFQLIVDAGNDGAVQRLRQRKQRPHKPFAVMYPSLQEVKRDCWVSPMEEALLTSPEAPIVLLGFKPGSPLAPEYKSRSPLAPEYKSRSPLAPGFKPGSPLAPSVAPDNPTLGVMLPYTPLHHLLLQAIATPVVATSGNLSDEPICTDEGEVLERLGQIADGFLVHDRPIARPVDDSVARVVLDRVTVLRRARGYAPFPLLLSLPKGQSSEQHPRVLAVGGHLKNTVALYLDGQVFLSQHIGDLSTTQAYVAFEETLQSLSNLYEFVPEAIACDAHPDYRSTQFARQLGDRLSGNKPGAVSVTPVQHHYAHVLACMAEHRLFPPVLGVAWDGTGYGGDRTIWGGEFLAVAQQDFQRVAHWRRFPLPGGDKAVKEPRRSALGLLYALFGDAVFEMDEMKELEPLRAFSQSELTVLQTVLQKGLNAPLTSSAGRLFDAVAALLGLCPVASFEGQAAMLLEFAIDGVDTGDRYPIAFFDGDASNDPRVLDWEPLIQGILTDRQHQQPVSLIAAKFHNTLVEAIALVANYFNNRKVVLTGGCFQNKYLLERTVQRLFQAGLEPYWHQQIPTNDGGIAVGQILAFLLKI